MKCLFTSLFLLFSFYYTEKAIEIIEQKDPIMKRIEEEKKKEEQLAVDAVVDGSFVTPGYAGLTIDSKKSFTKMKKYGAYNDSLVVWEEVKPVISKEDYYDKYITTGNGVTSNIALVFPVKKEDSIKEIKEILDEKNVLGTFFVDGIFLETKKEEVMTLVSRFHEVELLSYDAKYDSVLFEASLDNLRSFTNQKGKYCYAEYDREEVLSLCQKEHLHTIIPTLKIEKNPYHTVKGKVRSGSILSILITKENIEELPIVIDYLKQRGFVMDTLDNLLSEARNIDK